MIGYDANGYYGYGELLSAEAAKPVVLLVKRVEMALFYTATHKAQVWAGDELIAETHEGPQALRDSEFYEWAREQIYQNRRHLQDLGIDVKAEFAKFGGDAKDIYI